MSLNDYISSTHGYTPSSTQIIQNILSIQLRHFIDSATSKGISIDIALKLLDRCEHTHNHTLNILQHLHLEDIPDTLNSLALDFLHHLIAISIVYQAEHPIHTPSPAIPISSPFTVRGLEEGEDNSEHSQHTLHSHSIQAAYLEYQRISNRHHLNKKTIHLL